MVGEFLISSTYRIHSFMVPAESDDFALTTISPLLVEPPPQTSNTSGRRWHTGAPDSFHLGHMQRLVPPDKLPPLMAEP